MDRDADGAMALCGAVCGTMLVGAAFERSAGKPRRKDWSAPRIDEMGRQQKRRLARSMPAAAT